MPSKDERITLLEVTNERLHEQLSRVEARIQRLEDLLLLAAIHDEVSSDARIEDSDHSGGSTASAVGRVPLEDITGDRTADGGTGETE